MVLSPYSSQEICFGDIPVFQTLKLSLVAAALVAIATVAIASSAQAGGPAGRADRLARQYASTRPWHGQYSHTNYGQPLALVVPPTAKSMGSYSWGVSQNEIRPLYHQFGRPYPGNEAGLGNLFLPTPYWPSHTDQFGVYPVRGPW